MMKTPYERHIAHLEAIPVEIRDLPIWCPWKLVKKAGKAKPDKMPVSPINGRTKGWNKPGFATDAATAIQYAEDRPGLRGVGLILGIVPDLAGGDLDGCRDPATGEPTREARAILEEAGTYTEVSPGLRGFRFLFFGSFGGHTGPNNAAGIEFYEDSRFLTFTGEQVDDTPFAIEQRDLTELGKKHFPEKGAKPTGGQAPDGWQPVDLHALGLSEYTIKLIQTGGAGKDRSVAIFGACKDLVRAGCDDATICRVLADPANGISAGALERRRGNVDSAMRWIAEHNIPNARAEVRAEPKIDLSGFNAGKVDPETGEVEPPSFSLAQFALNGHSQEMRSKMLDDVHILGRLALLGQLTAFYTERNGGKTLLTLWLLIDAIRSGRINPTDVCYVNSDDNHKGLVEKTEIAERHGFNMLADGYQGFKNALLVDRLEKMAKHGQARGQIIILDTLKKFVDPMNKKESSDFMTSLRAFAVHGGSVIMLGHVNKHRDENGKLVFSGTADVVDDADCVYIMDKVARDGRTIVTFDNFKARGDVAEKAVYSFERNPDGGQTYAQLLDTVQPVDEEELRMAREAARVESRIAENSKIIVAVLDAIGEGITKRTELIDAVHATTGESKRRVIQTLDTHTGTNFLTGARWRIVKGEKNAKVYQRLELFSSFSGAEGGGSEKLKNWKV